MLQSVSKNCLPSCSGMWTSRRLIWISIHLFLCKEFWNMAIGVIGNYYYAIMAKIELWIFAKICVHSIPSAFHIYVPFQTQERRNTDAIV